MEWTEINGAVMRHTAEGNGPVLVLVHEMGGTLHSYDIVAPILAKKYTVVRYDIRGAGLSEKTRGRLEIDILSDDIAGLLDYRRIEGPVALAGTAVGAAVAMNFALRNSGRAIGIAGFSPVTACAREKREAIEAHADRIENDGLRTLVGSSMSAILPEALRHDQVAFQAARARWLANDPASFASIYRMFASLNLDPALSGLDLPCLMVGAKLDVLRPPADVRGVASLLPQGRYLEIESGHIAALQTPELYLATLSGFLDEVSEPFRSSDG